MCNPRKIDVYGLITFFVIKILAMLDGSIKSKEIIMIHVGTPTHMNLVHNNNDPCGCDPRKIDVVAQVLLPLYM
jgi:hypothetical protein